MYIVPTRKQWKQAGATKKELKEYTTLMPSLKTSAGSLKEMKAMRMSPPPSKRIASFYKLK